ASSADGLRYLLRSGVGLSLLCLLSRFLDDRDQPALDQPAPVALAQAFDLAGRPRGARRRQHDAAVERYGLRVVVDGSHQFSPLVADDDSRSRRVDAPRRREDFDFDLLDLITGL